MLLSSVPPNGEVSPLLTVTEIRLAKVPSGLNSETWADP
jgi:hypothetical protein